MRCDFRDKYGQLTPMNQRRFREHLIEKFDWGTKQSFYNLIAGKHSISEIERDYIDDLFAEYFWAQRATMEQL